MFEIKLNLTFMLRGATTIGRVLAACASAARGSR